MFIAPQVTFTDFWMELREKTGKIHQSRLWVKLITVHLPLQDQKTEVWYLWVLWNTTVHFDTKLKHSFAP